jgi:hypothetical protein
MVQVILDNTPYGQLKSIIGVYNGDKSLVDKLVEDVKQNTSEHIIKKIDDIYKEFGDNPELCIKIINEELHGTYEEED